MKRNIIVLLVAMALLVGILSGCTETTEEEEEEEEEEETPTMPTATFTYTPMVNITNTTQIDFTAVVTLGDAVNITYLWDFGDDTTATEATVNHTYTTVGTYNVTLTVTDEDDETLTDTSEITSIEVVAEV